MRLAATGVRSGHGNPLPCSDTSELRRPRRELQSRGRFTLSPGLGAGIPPLTYACAVGCRPFSAHETQPTGRKPGSGVDTIASTTTLVRASGGNSSANDVDDPVSGDITEVEGLSLARTEPPRVPRSPIHLMCSPHRARRPRPRQGGRWSVGKKIQRTHRPLPGRTGVPQSGKVIRLQGFAALHDWRPGLPRPAHRHARDLPACRRARRALPGRLVIPG